MPKDTGDHCGDPWRVFYVFQSTPNGSQPPIRHVAPSGTDLYTFMRLFGSEAGLGLYRHMDTDPESPTIGQHLFQSGSVKLSIVPTQAKDIKTWLNTNSLPTTPTIPSP